MIASYEEFRVKELYEGIRTQDLEFLVPGKVLKTGSRDSGLRVWVWASCLLETYRVAAELGLEKRNEP